MQATPLLSVQSDARHAAARRVLVAVALLVLLVHWAFLSGWLLGARGKPPSDAPAATLIQFREVTLPPPAPAPAPTVQAQAGVSRAESVTTPASPVPSAAERDSQAALEPPADPAPAVPDSAPAPTQDPEPDTLAQAASQADPIAPTEQPAMSTQDSTDTQAWPGVEADTPVYRVALPPGFQQSYVLRRGALTGTAVMSWAPAGGRYELSLTGNALGVSLVQRSQGRFDVTGLEPERFTTKTSGRTELAANFQREQGVISFSGPSRRYAWRLGAQDRLSVYVQLSAILAAESSRLTEGQRFGLPVVSERGDANIWTFRILGWENVSTKSGDVRAVRLMREMRKPQDQSAEIWLDEKRHYAPVRIRLGEEDDPHRLELLRE